jgi:hypothetical protein
MPAIYASHCHTKNTWSMSRYPGATFALVESLISITCLALLIQASALSVIIDYVPRFFLRTIPRASSRLWQRMAGFWDPESNWKPNCYAANYELDSSQGEYDCSQLTENFGAKNVSLIQAPMDQSAFFLNDSRFTLGGNSTMLGGRSPEQSQLNLSLIQKLV